MWHSLAHMTAMKTGRPAVWDQYAAIWESKYLGGASRGEIAKEYGTSVQTVSRVLAAHGVTFEGRVAKKRNGPLSDEHRAAISVSRLGKGTGPRVQHETRICPIDGKEFKYIPSKTGATYCSPQCRNIGTGIVTKNANQEAYEADPKMCPCGEAIPYEKRHSNSYCSPEHRSEFQAKRQPDDANWITFNCECCDKEVTRPKKYGNGASRFCSNECSAKSNTQRRASVDDMVLDSGYEAFFYGLCRLWKIKVERFDRADCVSIGNGWYGPDFLVAGLWYVEVKGHEDDDDRSRYASWKEQRGRLAVLRDEDLKTIAGYDAHQILDFLAIRALASTVTS